MPKPKPLKPWEREDLTAAIVALIESLRQCVPPERADGGRVNALVGASCELERIAQRLGSRGPSEALECCDRLRDLRHKYDYRRDGPEKWSFTVNEIISKLEAMVAPDPPETLAPHLTAMQNRILTYLWERKSASYEDLHDGVWSDRPVTDEAIRKAIERLADKLAQLRTSFTVETSNGHAILVRSNA